jgi:hypothetical protein
VTRSYEDAARHWAAAKFDIPVEKIKRVAIGCSVDGYETSGYYTSIDIEIIYITEGKATRELGGYQLDEVLRGVLEHAN